VSAKSAPIHQALHGYRDGHRLLASSTKIDDADQRRMLVLSDSADARHISPEQPLLTAYPLPSGSFHILAFTWPALEIRRPGCVWTHSLLVNESLLSAPNLLPLLDLFDRPHDTEAPWERYQRPLSVAIEDTDDQTLAALPRLPQVTETALWTLYEPPGPPIDLRSAALTGNDPHRLMLAIWLQQQPSLRRAFSFAQAPRTARRLDQQLFDLQLTHAPQQATWEQSAGLAKPRTVTKPLESRPPDWCLALAEDLRHPGSLRAFLCDFGSGDLASREGVWALASLFTALDPSRRTTLVDGITALSRVCPHPDEARELRQALLSPEIDPRLPFAVNPLDVILALFASGSEEDPELDLGPRLTALLGEDEDRAIDFTHRLLGHRRTKSAKIALEAVASNLTDDQIERWADHDEMLIVQLAAQSEQLLTRRSLFSSVSFNSAWPVLGRRQMAKGKRLALLKGALSTGAGDFAEAAVSSWPDATELLLEAVDSTGSTVDDPKLLADAKPKVVVQWLQKNGPSPAVASALLNAWPAKKLEKIPVAEWDHLLESGGTLNDFTLVLLFLAAVEPDAGLGPRTAIHAYDNLFPRLSPKAKLKSKAANRLREAASSHDAKPSRQAADLLAAGFINGDWPTEELLSITRPTALREVLASPRAAPLIAALIPALDSAGASKQYGEIVWDALFASQDISLVKKVLTPIREAFLWPSRFLKP
jgi:GTPase-associated protein 1, N-terminal domain type 1